MNLFIRPAPLLLLSLSFATQAMAQLPPVVTNTNTARARVIVIEDPDATYDLQPVPDRIQAMVDCGLTNLTGKANVSEAWRSLVSPQDTVGIKVFSAPGPNSGTRPAVVAAVLQGLIAAGVPADKIIIWDKRSIDLRLAGFYEFEKRYGVHVLGSQEAGYDEAQFYEAPALAPLSTTDVDFGKSGLGMGRKSYISKLVTQRITKIINLSPLMHHNLAGVSGNLYSISLGSADNTVRFETNPFEMNKAVPEIYAQHAFGDKVAGERIVLSVTDALICQYAGQHRSLLHYSTVLNQLRFSRDPVALDALSLEEINRQCALAGVKVLNTNLSLLRNAQLLEIGVSDLKRIDVTKLNP